MKSKFFLLESILMISVIIAVSNLVHPLTPENRIAVTLDKKIYSLDEEVMVTVANLSDETITFPTWECGLELQRWNGTVWEHITWYQKQALRDLGPHENAVVAPRGLIDQLGEYRVGTWGVWAEFEVREPNGAWTLLTGAGIIVVVAIVTAYFLKKRKRG